MECGDRRRSPAGRRIPDRAHRTKAYRYRSRTNARVFAGRWYIATDMSALKAASLIRDIPDFPKPGIIFKDITPVLQDPQAFHEVVDRMTDIVARHDPSVIMAIESRGFLFGAPMALKLEVPLVVARKLGKLPYERITEEYSLEYGTNTIEIHADAIKEGDRVAIVDDLLATGGTALACARLTERLGGTVATFAFMVELTFLPGRHALRGYDVGTLIEY